MLDTTKVFCRHNHFQNLLIQSKNSEIEIGFYFYYFWIDWKQKGSITISFRKDYDEKDGCK
jgi:hypothetical protein